MTRIVRTGGIQIKSVKSVKSVGIKIKSSLQIYPTNVFHRNGGTFVGLVGLVFL